MKFLTIILTLLIAGGCTSLKPVDLSPEQLHKQISLGTIANEGDHVKIETSDGKHYKLKVTAITDSHIVGRGNWRPKLEIPIKDIVALERDKFGGAKTDLLNLTIWALLIMLTLSALPV